MSERIVRMFLYQRSSVVVSPVEESALGLICGQESGGAHSIWFEGGGMLVGHVRLLVGCFSSIRVRGIEIVSASESLPRRRIIRIHVHRSFQHRDRGLVRLFLMRHGDGAHI